MAQNETASESVEIVAGSAVAATEAPTPSPVSVPEAPTSAPVAPPVGSVVESPPELKWELNADTGVFFGELEMGVVVMENFWGKTTTRGFNGQVCGCVL